MSDREIFLGWIVLAILQDGFFMGGCAYIVFGLHRSPWWFMLAVPCSYWISPGKWKKMWTQHSTNTTMKKKGTYIHESLK